MQGYMETLALHFDFSDHPPPEDADLSQFRRKLSRSLEQALRTSGTGRWRGGRYARGVATLFIEASDRQGALERVHEVLAAGGLTANITVTGSGSDRLP
jgi:hypothetical protein